MKDDSDGAKEPPAAAAASAGQPVAAVVEGLDQEMRPRRWRGRRLQEVQETLLALVLPAPLCFEV